jgi:hypothetical protein
MTSSIDERVMPFSVKHVVADLEGAIDEVAGQRVELLARQRHLRRSTRLALALLDVRQLDA